MAEARSGAAHDPDVRAAAARFGSRHGLASARRRRFAERRVGIVGAGPHLRSVLNNLAGTPSSGFRAAAIWMPVQDDAPHPCAIPVYDDFDAFARHVRSEALGELWLALPLSEQATIARVTHEFCDDFVNVRFLPDMTGIALFDAGMVELAGAPAINLIASPLSRRATFLKSLFDRSFASLALLVLAPLLVVIAIAVKLTSRGPVLFRQQRMGADGRVFRICKFRSMRLHREEPGVVRQATRHDARITPIGRFLRRTSLDELPQFFNVLCGQMSVVGPRPHALEHDTLYRKVVAGYIHRYRVKPGITGWAQVNGYRGETDSVEKMQRRVELDLYYLRNWSFWFDLRIIGATIVNGFMHHNAY